MTKPELTAVLLQHIDRHAVAYDAARDRGDLVSMAVEQRFLTEYEALAIELGCDVATVDVERNTAEVRT